MKAPVITWYDCSVNGCSYPPSMLASVQAYGNSKKPTIRLML